MTEREKKLSHSRLCEVLNYDSETGIFRWATRTSNRIKVGDVAGMLNNWGHRIIYIDGSQYMAHRLAWLYVHERWPEDEIDHKNLAKDDNRIDNLREATSSQNKMNRRVRSNSTHGLKGVVRHFKGADRFQARITVDGQIIHLGLFDSAEAAHEAYADASKKYHGQFRRVA